MRAAALSLAAASLIWLVLLVAAPWIVERAPARAAARAAAAIYLAGGVICHQRPERTLHPWGRPMPVCGRCFGLYAAAPFGAAAALAAGALGFAARPRAASVRWILLVAATPTIATMAGEWSGLAAPSSIDRAAAALPLGAAVAWVVVRAVDRQVEG
jgi:uncharacterized membrane protein